MLNVVVCIEQYDVLGVLPSQLESLALLATAMNFNLAYVDGTKDGVFGTGIPRHGSWEEFFATTEGPYTMMDPNGEDIREADIKDGWLCFGPSMGWRGQYEFDKTCSIPGGVLNSRDAIPIAAWELSTWREQ